MQKYPAKIVPHYCSERGHGWQGSLPLSAFPRLKGLVLNPEAPVEFELRFGKEDRRRVVRGKVKVRLRLICQRCLEPVEIPIEQPIALGIVETFAEGESLPEPLEPLVTEEHEEIPFTDIMEEEIILALPPFPKHERCGPEVKTAGEEALQGESPFAILRQLKPKEEREDGRS